MQYCTTLYYTIPYYTLLNCTLFSCFCYSLRIVAWSNSFSSNLSNPILSNFQRRHPLDRVQEQFPRDLLLYTMTSSCLLQKQEKIGIERFEENELDYCCNTLYYTTLYYTVLYYTLLYIDVQRIMKNISIRYGSEWVTFCCSYVLCHKMVTNGPILEFEVSTELYWALLLDTSM